MTGMVTLVSTGNWYLGSGVKAVDGSFNFAVRLRDNVTEFCVSGPAALCESR